ncbi:uncharacterized protein LOC141635723 [Silene latifolia]|uniref:uncharacterized protein LOC141635723 n=1 Tax=Silene latifolia TaxID=37657 RepID=UPI003D7771B1
MRARYYPDGCFLKAGMGSKPSYVWRGIMEAKVVLVKGLRKRIGDKWSTKVWQDAWLPHTPYGRVLSPCTQGNKELLVGELLNADGGWKEEKLTELFLPFEKERVLNIRVSSNRPSDIWYWKPEKDGIYTVKLTYYLLAREVCLDVGCTSDRESERWLWNWIWKTPVWPRVKLFFWHLIHIFKDCHVVKQVWEGLDVDVGEDIVGGGIQDWVQERWKELGVREHSVFMVGCWALWEHRNKVVFKRREVDPWSVIRRTKDMIEEGEGSGFVLDKSRATKARRRNGEEGGWMPAPSGFVKINVDASMKEGEGVSCGVVCRDTGGQVLSGVSIVQERVWEAHVAEAVVVLEGMKELKRCVWAAPTLLWKVIVFK